MIENLNEFMSTNMAAAKRSAIREILKLTQRPEVISFAGGLPAPASFPVKDIKQCIDEILDEAGPRLCSMEQPKVMLISATKSLSTMLVRE